jgi:isoquinoline 1-oxidoreductase beta subunit
VEISRRHLLAGAAITGGLVVAYTLVPRTFDAPLSPARGEYAFDAWIKIADDGIVTVAVPQLEMGQGVTTLIPQIVAQELGADWRQIAVETAPISGAYANTVLAAKWASLWAQPLEGWASDPASLLATRFAQDNRFTATGDGTTLAAYEMPCREAAATARAMLSMEAADRWGVNWEDCFAAGGFIRHENKRFRFAELAAGAAEQSPPSTPPLLSTPPSEASPGLTLDVGEGDEETAPEFPRLDIPAKIDGTFLFAADVRLPDMVYAAIRHGPLDDAELTSFDEAAVRDMPGLAGVVKGKRWLAAAGETHWVAERALDAMNPRFAVARPVNSARIEETLDRAIKRGKAKRIHTRGQGDRLMEKPDLALRYDFAPALHASVETTCATARLLDGKLELWMASQAPQQARLAAARTLGLGERDVVLYPMPAGGSFDRTYENAIAIEAALIAREIGRPVQLTWSRWQEHLASRPRTPAVALLTARLGGEGDIAMLRSRWALPATAREFGKRLFDNTVAWTARDEVAGQADPLALEGAMPGYGIADVAVDHVPATIPLATGRLRGNAHVYTAFATESFVDEVAARYEREPLSFRIAMLGQDPRMVECLQRAARLAQWDGGRTDSTQGLACHWIDGGRIALVASAALSEGGFAVERLSAAVDIGRVVNRDIARQQIEGGLLFGLGLALGSSTQYEKGLPSAYRLAQLNLPRLADTPEISVEFIASDAPLADPGELGVAVIAPALANAIHAATGLRLRRMPLIADGL